LPPTIDRKYPCHESQDAKEFVTKPHPIIVPKPINPIDLKLYEPYLPLGSKSSDSL